MSITSNKVEGSLVCKPSEANANLGTKVLPPFLGALEIETPEIISEFGIRYSIWRVPVKKK
jgi:hypothetical protein